MTSCSSRVAVVTGGSRGLGLTIASALAADGYAVAVTASRSSARFDLALRHLRSIARHPENVWGTVADATSAADAESTIEAVTGRFGHVDALVNNAGRGMRMVSETFTTEPVPFWDVPEEAWRHIIDVNTNGPFLWSRAVVHGMRGQGHGRIVNVSTSAGTMVRRGYAPYGPSKAALEAMTRSFAADLAGSGVTANLLLPGGATDTDLLPGGAGRRGADGKLLDPAVMAAPARWLCSPASGEYNGARFIASQWNPSLPLAERISATLSPHAVGERV